MGNALNTPSFPAAPKPLVPRPLGRVGSAAESPLPLWALAVAYVLWAVFCLVFDPYPENAGHSEAVYTLLMWTLLGSFFLAAFSYGLATLLALVALVMGRERARAGWMLAACLVSPACFLFLFLLLNPYA